MARMIPHFDAPEVIITGDGATGEIALYKFVHEHLPQDWTVIYNLHIRSSTKESQIDFLVVAPGKGIINLECKGYGYEWRNGSFSHPMLEKTGALDLFSQARGAVANVNTFLVNELFQGSPYGSFGYVLVFPVTDFQGAIPGGNPYIDASRLPQLKTTIDDELNRYSYNFRYFTPDVEKAIISYFEKAVPSIRRTGEKEQNDRLLDNLLTYPQEQAYQMICLSRYVHVRGTAGTGKTWIAKSVLERFSKEGKKVLYVCFNNMPAVDLRKQIRPECLKKGCVVTNFHKLGQALLNRSVPAKPPVRDGKVDWDAVNRHIMAEIQLPGKDKFDVLLVDEAQDLKIELILFLLTLIKRDRHVAIFSDTGQSIYSNTWTLPDNSFGTRLETISLPMNMRNSQRIHAMCKRISREATLSQPMVAGAEVLYSTDRPETVVKSFLDEGIKANQIAILSDMNECIDDIKNIAGSPVYGQKEKEADTEKNFLRWRKGECIWKSTLHSFKGLEADYVVFVIAKDQLPDEELYVGCSRAKYRLVIVSQSYRIKTFCEQAQSQLCTTRL